MPTLLGLADIKTPDTMDGKSLASLIVHSHTNTQPNDAWRTAQLIEYYGLGTVRDRRIEFYTNTEYTLTFPPHR